MINDTTRRAPRWVGYVTAEVAASVRSTDGERALVTIVPAEFAGTPFTLNVYGQAAVDAVPVGARVRLQLEVLS